MNARSLTGLFIVVLAFHLAAILSAWNIAEKSTKPLLMPLLFVVFMSQAGTKHHPFKVWIILALLFSWIGDLLLMFQLKGSVFFLSGLVSFLLAHIAYIIFFHRIRVAKKVKPRLWILLVVAAYYAVLISFLTTWLGSMLLPVRIYGLVISFMLMMALHMLFIPEWKRGVGMAAGAILFVISDSVLAINKFYHPFAMAGFWVMLTYGSAQLLLVWGAGSYDRDMRNDPGGDRSMEV